MIDFSKPSYCYKYPERGQAWVMENVCCNKDIRPDFLPAALSVVERMLKSDEFTDKEREVYQHYIVECLTLNETGKLMGISGSRSREILMHAARKLHSRKNIKIFNTAMEIPLREAEKFTIAREVRKEYFESDNWSIEETRKIYAYLSDHFTFFWYSRGEEKGYCPIRYDQLTEALEKEMESTTLEELFHDIDEDVCELMNQYFMDHPYINYGDVPRAVPKTLYIDYGKILRNRKPKTYDPKVIDPMKHETFIDRVKAYKVKLKEMENEAKIPDDEPISEPCTMRYMLYFTLPRPDNIFYFLKDSGLLNKYDVMISKKQHKQIADRFMYWAENKYHGKYLKTVNAVFIARNLRDDPDWKTNLDEIAGRLSHKHGQHATRIAILGNMNVIRSDYMAESDEVFSKNRNRPIEEVIAEYDLSDTSIRTIGHLNAKTYGDFAKMVIDWKVTDAAFFNNWADINKVNQMLTDIKYIYYSTDGTFDDKSIVIPYLMEYKKVANEDVDYLKRRAIRMSSDVLLRPIIINQTKVITQKHIDALRNYEIRTIMDLINSNKKGFNFANVSGMTPYAAKMILIYMSYLNMYDVFTNNSNEDN